MTGKKNLAEIEKSEEVYFNRFFSKILGWKSNLVLSEKLIERYRNPGSKPIDLCEYAMYLLGDVEGKKVLDFGCGSGEDAVFLAKKGAIVSAFDISQEAVNLTRARAKENNVEDRIDLKVTNGHKLDYGSEEFDAVYGRSVLHHLDLDAASKEIRRVLKTGGNAVFIEPSINIKCLNTIKHIIKKTVPSKIYIPNTEHEEPLNYEKIAIMGAEFKHTYHREFSLIAKLDILYPNRKFARILQTADYFLFEYLPFTRKFGIGVVIKLVK
jgi:ubiquinone/menaquinone biosynthesis C-methylase UbiE